LFQSAQNPPRWPMYIRQAKQFLRNVDATFDERKFGFASLVDLMRACHAKRRLTSVIVTHNPDLAARCDRKFEMKARPM